MSRGTLIAIVISSALAGAVWADEEGKDIYHGKVEKRVNALASIQPGLGVVMHEIGYRFEAAYRSANGGNWGLAQYELKELLEAQEVAELTRPNRAAMLKAFEHNYLEPLIVSIEKKDTKQFNSRYSAAVDGCNACHTALGYGFIHFKVPSKPTVSVLDYNHKTEPKYDERREN